MDSRVWTFERFWDRYSPIIHERALRLTGDQDAADEIANEVARRLLNAFQTIEDRDNAEGLVRRTTKNTFIDMYRSGEKYSAQTLGPDDATIPSPGVADDNGSSMVNWLMPFLENLPPRVRECIAAYRANYCNASDTASALGWTKRRVRKSISQIKSRLSGVFDWGELLQTLRRHNADGSLVLVGPVKLEKWLQRVHAEAHFRWILSSAIDKLNRDFDGSCLQHLADWRRADGQSRLAMSVMMVGKKLRAGGRIPNDEEIVIPIPYLVGGRPPTAEEPDLKMRSAVTPLLEHCRRNRVVFNCGAYKPACLAVLTSLRRRYGLELTLTYEDITGGEQVRRLARDDETDYLVAPHGPFLMLGSGCARDYCRITPIHTFEQVVMEQRGRRGSGRKKLLIVANASPEEQLLTSKCGSDTTDLIFVEGIDELCKHIQTGLEPGDRIVAWDPFRHGMNRNGSWQEVGEPYQVWQTLFCHKRWRTGSLVPLKEQMKRLFLSEWQFCSNNRTWAEECLLDHPNFLLYFGKGTGLA